MKMTPLYSKENVWEIMNNREIYADKIYSDIYSYKETQECKKLSLFTPVKAIKGESPGNNQKGESGKRLVFNGSF